MVDLDMERAKNLLKSARDLFENGDYVGVAGLSYAAFESATIALTTQLNGKDYPSHNLRRKRAKTILKKHQDKIDFLWEIRNIDFYGNIRLGQEKREISADEVMESLNTVDEIIQEIEDILK